MLQQIELQFFKCFALLKLPVGPLTLLSGANASGKSSVMQALVLLHQTIRDHEWSTRLMVNGTSIRLGTASAVIDDVFGRRTCAIALLDGDTAYEWAFAGDRDEMSMGVERVRANCRSEEHPDALRDLLPVAFDDHRETVSLANRLRRLTYLTAERLGPREHYTHWKTPSSRRLSVPPESTLRACCTRAETCLFWIRWRFPRYLRPVSVRPERACFRPSTMRSADSWRRGAWPVDLAWMCTRIGHSWAWSRFRAYGCNRLFKGLAPTSGAH